MLETVKDLIKNVPQQSFASFYNSYILSVQDINLMHEIDATIRNNRLDIRKMSTYIATLQKEFENDKFS